MPSDWIVQGAIFDADGARPGYVRFRGNRVTESGLLGTESARPRVRRVRGVVVPPPVNAHTHLADAVVTQEPPPTTLEAIVEPPMGLKFRALAAASPAEKRRAIRVALLGMRREGIAATVDFREEGAAGVRLFREAASGLGFRAWVLGRPLRRPLDPVEVRELLEVADGIGVSSAREEPAEVRRSIARACRAAGKRFALHASEGVREPPEEYLDPRPDLLVHLTKATAADLAQVAETGVRVAVCPRSNALFGRRPNIEMMERVGLPLMIGTDNAMFHRPSIWRELEFAYVASRLVRRPVSAEYLARAAFVEPWRWMGLPEAARVTPESPVPPLVLRVPSQDPSYQLVTRVAEHLIVRTGPVVRPT